MSKFPPEWRELCGARFEWYSGHGEWNTVWNRDNHLVKLLSPSVSDHLSGVFGKSVDPLPHKEMLLSDISMAAGWVLRVLSQDSSELWRGIPERDPAFLPELFALLKKEATLRKLRRLMLWIQDPGNGTRLRIIDQEEWIAISADQDLSQYLPKASKVWTIDRPDGAGPVTKARRTAKART
jgi:hypothetical protein